MAATRYYFPIEGSGAPNISPAFDAGWEQTGQANRLKLLYKPTLSVLTALTATSTKTIPITTTQDILMDQFVSDPIPPQRIGTDCTVSFVMTFTENSANGNAFLAIVVKVVSQDGGTVRGTLYSNFNADIEFSVNPTTNTRIINAQAVTALTTQPGDRLVIDVGAHVAAPAGATVYAGQLGNNNAADFALTSSLTTALNPWIEFSKDLYNVDNNNYKALKVGDGMSVTEKIR